MKRIVILSLIFLTKFLYSQNTWNLSLNTIGGVNPNFGTASNHPINFFTNNTQRMQCIPPVNHVLT